MATTENVENSNKKIMMTLDEAMLATGLGAYNIMHMLMCGMMLAGMIMQSMSLSFIMPAARCDFQMTADHQSWLAPLPFAAIILTSYFWGWIADTRGRRPVLLYAMLASVFFSVLASLSPNLITFAVFTFLSSIFMAACTGVSYTYLGEFNSSRYRNKMVATGASFVGFANIIIPALSWFILTMDFYVSVPFLDIVYRPWRLLVVACTTPFIISVILLLFASESPKFLNANGQQEECIEVLKTIYSINKCRPKDDFHVKAIIAEDRPTPVGGGKYLTTIISSMKEQTAPLLRRPLLQWTCLTCFVQFGTFASANGLFIWLPSILDALAKYQGETTEMCNILVESSQFTDIIANSQGTCIDSIDTDTFKRSIYVGLMLSSMYVVAAMVLDLIGKKMILFLVLGFAGICGVSVPLVSNHWLGMILFAALQMSGACIGIMNIVTVELFPTKYRAMAVCLAMLMGRVGSVSGSKLFHTLLQNHCVTTFCSFGSLLIMCSLMCLTLPNMKSSGKQKPDSNNGGPE